MSQPIKVPPHNIDLEVTVLASILIDKNAITDVAEFLRPEHFYRDAHNKIFEGMLRLYERREPIDVLTLSEELKKMKILKEIGGIEALADLVEQVPTAANTEQYGHIVKDYYTRRQLISAAAEMQELGFDDSKSVSQVMDKAEQNIFALSQNHTANAFIPLKEILSESFDRLEMLQKSAGQMRGVPTGFADLDRILAGMHPSNLIILAARPGTGKTAFSLNMAQHVAVNLKMPVGYFSLEISREELVDRLLVSQADIDASRLKTGRLDKHDLGKLSEAMGVLADATLFIDDTPGLNILEMRTKARRLKAEQDLKMIIVDYLQLVHGRGLDNRVQEVAEISQGLKNLARELKVPVISLSQLSRAVESRSGNQPQLSDLRDSGSIEQDADVVMFLYREDDENREQVTLGIAKHRNGPVGSVPLFFRGDRIKFYGMERRAAAG